MHSYIQRHRLLSSALSVCYPCWLRGHSNEDPSASVCHIDLRIYINSFLIKHIGLYSVCKHCGIKWQSDFNWSRVKNSAAVFWYFSVSTISLGSRGRAGVVHYVNCCQWLILSVSVGFTKRTFTQCYHSFTPTETNNVIAGTEVLIYVGMTSSCSFKWLDLFVLVFSHIVFLV